MGLQIWFMMVSVHVTYFSKVSDLVPQKILIKCYQWVNYM